MAASQMAAVRKRLHDSGHGVRMVENWSMENARIFHGADVTPDDVGYCNNRDKHAEEIENAVEESI